MLTKALLPALCLHLAALVSFHITFCAYHKLSLSFMIRVIPAWLGLKATALAWPGATSACSIPRPGQSCQLWLGSSLAWPGPRLLYVTMKKKLCSSLVATVWKHFNKDDVHVQLAHLSVQTYLTPEEIQTGKVKHFSFSTQSMHTLISWTCLFMLCFCGWTILMAGSPSPISILP